MRGILADANITGHWGVLFRGLESKEWKELWTSLALITETFPSLGISVDYPDLELWRLCQARELILITSNRNKHEHDSLEATIQSHNTPASLPVFTLANADRIIKSKSYAARVVERLLGYLLEIDNIRGTGRIYLP